jgi:RHS repeat-associated protein
VKTRSKCLILTSAVLTFGCLAAQAQNCSAWSNVKRWQGSYSMNGSGTFSTSFAAYTINESTAASVSLDSPVIGTCPGTLVWVDVDSNYAGSVDDTFVRSCTPLPGNLTNTLTGTEDASTSNLVIDVSKGTYRFQPGPGSNAQSTILDCLGNTTTQTLTEELYPFTNWPLSFALPSSVQPLVVNNFAFQAASYYDGAPGVVPWTLSFTLTPILNDNIDDPCQQSGGSSIGCQNQSLGEDVSIVGTPYFLHYESVRMPGRNGANSVAQADAVRMGGWTLNVHHAYDAGSGTLFLGDGGQRSAWQLGGPTKYNGNSLVTSQDGSEVYVFDGTSGLHVQTLKPMTGALKYQFVYDASGNLTSVTDGSGNVTSIQLDGSGHPTGIVSPFGLTTTLVLDSNGSLAEVTDPAGNISKFSNTSLGLITTRTDANGNLYNYAYDASGALTLDSDPAGGSTTVSRTNSSSGYVVTTTTALGVKSSFQVTSSGDPDGEQLTNTWPNGLNANITNTQSNGQLSEITTLPDGTTDNKTMGPDPRWGIQAPVPTLLSLVRGNLTMTTTFSRTATLGTAGNPFSLTTQSDIETMNGRVYTSVFTGSTKTYVDTTPMGRKTTTVLDALERPSSTQLGTLLPLQFAYDGKGRLSTMTQGPRITSIAYDANGFLSSVTDPLKLQTSFTHNAAGQVLTATLPDGRNINYGHDANGNLTSIIPPGKTAHDFAYTAVDLPSGYTPPGIPGGGATSYAYDADRNLTTITRPDSKTVQLSYDSAGRLSSTIAPTETINYSYDASTGHLSSASIPGGEAIAYGYNGPMQTSSTWTGIVSGGMARVFGKDFWVTSESINGANAIAFTFDKDGLMTKAGSLVFKNNPNGLITRTTLGSATDNRTYDGFGALTAYSAKYLTGTLYSVNFARDSDGRIVRKVETIGGTTNTFVYTYDHAGRLTKVSENGTIGTYTYDTNSNRLTAKTVSGTVAGTYDAQDRLLTYGGTSYQYTANGELASQKAGTQTTSYTYDALGNLIGVTLPSGTQITYITDAENHRVGKTLSGALQSGFLYDGDTIVAQLSGTNAIVSQFIYDSANSAPIYMVQAGVTYRIFSDQLGSPRLVVNTSTGAVAQEIDYDEFGNIVKDTNPGFQPFGFAGGLYDQDTKFVRFGARDYAPAIGRWTAKDPILFDGGDTDLYGYVFNDPVNLKDPTGLSCKKKKKTAKERIEQLAHAVTGDKISLGPVDVSTDKPQVSAGGKVEVKVGEVTVVSVAGTVAVGITPTGTASQPLFFVKTHVSVSVGGMKVGEGETVHEFGDASKLQVTQDLLKNVHQADKCDPECQ